MAAFDLALQMGVRHIELDVQATCDHHIVVIHDATVNRTTNGSGAVASLTLADLRKLDAGSWFGKNFTGIRIPTFDEVLACYKERLHIHTEIKGNSPFVARRTADLVRRHSMTKQVTVTSFQTMHLKEIRAYAPELQTGWLVAEANEAIAAEARTLGVSQLCPCAVTLTPEAVNRLHDQGFTVRAWGVTSEELMRLVVRAGADGMTVNFPDKLIAYLNEQDYPWT